MFNANINIRCSVVVFYYFDLQDLELKSVLSVCDFKYLQNLSTSSRLFIWEILHSTIRKMNKHVQKIQKELEEAKDKLEKQQHKRVTL